MSSHLDGRTRHASTSPPFRSDAVTLTGAVELKDVIGGGGDAVEYSVRGDRVDFAIFDAVGHDAAAGQVAARAVAVYREHRDRGSLFASALEIDRHIATEFGPARFATGQLGQLDLRTGLLKIWNAGHPPPLVLRSGNAYPLACPPEAPFGLGALVAGATGSTTRRVLLPGDVVVLFTDGIVDARNPGGAEFGVERLAAGVRAALDAGLSPTEALSGISLQVARFQGGRLADDASILVISWHPPPLDAF